MATAFVSFGGNVGDVAATFDEAAERINYDYGEVVRLSSLYSTPAVGEHAGDAFLNAVAEVESFLSPAEMLHGLQRIENELGRERTVRWGPRTLDLDLLLYNDLILDSDELTLPHPRCWYRKFVLDGLAEIAGSLVHPVKGISLSELRRRINARPLEVAVTDAGDGLGRRLVESVNERFFDADAMPYSQPDPETTFVVWHAESSGDFEALPRVSRLDLTLEFGDPTDALRDVLISAGLCCADD